MTLVERLRALRAELDPDRWPSTVDDAIARIEAADLALNDETGFDCRENKRAQPCFDGDIPCDGCRYRDLVREQEGNDA